jgi:hypothetical protein
MDASSTARRARPPHASPDSEVTTWSAGLGAFTAVANESDRLQKTIEAERAERMAAYGARLHQLAVRPSARKGRIKTILAEGDSWFDYPVPGATDVIRSLEQLLKLPIANMAHYGEEVRQMLSLKQRQEIERRLSTGAPDGKPWDAMLFSGGGNDVVGDQLCIWLKSYTVGMPAHDVLDTERLDAVLEIVQAGYQDLITMRNAITPKTKLFFHQYDFALPNGHGVCTAGPWLRPSLIFRQVPGELRVEVVKLMLQRFAQAIASVSAGAPYVFLVPTQGTFPAPTSEWWANELHPTNRGFKAIAEKFQVALAETLLDPEVKRQVHTTLVTDPLRGRGIRPASRPR